ncbi:Las1-like-domain-containing protein [Pilobolus umbonatus]|nr:Las1-like-domain-containing protein [Pilobolus umbonatus]
MSAHIVPWVNFEEFETVYNYLFADRKTDKETVQKGIDRVQAWISRSGVPFSVEITSTLIQVVINDDRHDCNLTHKELRLMYAMALTRFVNGLVDAAQTGKFAKSIHHLARDINLPAFFVDLRHASTHDNLPNLTLLREGALQAIDWLHERYWLLNLKQNDTSKPISTINTVKSKLNEYKEHRLEYLNSDENNNKAYGGYMDAIEHIIKISNHAVVREEIIPMLLSGLLPVSKKRQTVSDNLRMAGDLTALWSPLLQGLDIGFPDFGKELIIQLLDKLTSASEPQNKDLPEVSPGYTQTMEDATNNTDYLWIITYWLKHLIHQSYDRGQKRTCMRIDINDILDPCLRNFNVYTYYILQTLKDVDPDIKEIVDHLDSYIFYSFSPTSDTPKENVNPKSEAECANEITTLNERLYETKAIVDPKVTMTAAAEEGDHVWTLSCDWNPCPIGTLPGGVIPCLDISALQSTVEYQ